MQISYRKMWKLLIDMDISPVTLRKSIGIASGTMTKLRKNEPVSLDVLGRICAYLSCDLSDLVVFRFDESIRERVPLAMAQ